MVGETSGKNNFLWCLGQLAAPGYRPLSGSKLKVAFQGWADDIAEQGLAAKSTDDSRAAAGVRTIIIAECLHTHALHDTRPHWDGDQWRLRLIVRAIYGRVKVKAIKVTSVVELRY